MAARHGWELRHLQAWRRRRWLTQRALAERSGVGYSTICRAEIGGGVNAETAKRLAEALDVTPDDLRSVAPETADATA